MLTVEILDQALSALRQIGIEPRMEWLGGSGGGECEFAGRRWLFLDLAQTPSEQLEAALACLASEPALQRQKLPDELARLLTRRKIA
jgi:hypothetical protein